MTFGMFLGGFVVVLFMSFAGWVLDLLGVGDVLAYILMTIFCVISGFFCFKFRNKDANNVDAALGPIVSASAFFFIYAFYYGTMFIYTLSNPSSVDRVVEMADNIYDDYLKEHSSPSVSLGETIKGFDKEFDLYKEFDFKYEIIKEYYAEYKDVLEDPNLSGTQKKTFWNKVEKNSKNVNIFSGSTLEVNLKNKVVGAVVNEKTCDFVSNLKNKMKQHGIENSVNCDYFKQGWFIYKKI